MPIDLNKEAGLLQVLADEVRAKTLRLLGEAKDTELMWSPHGIANHILWQAGHILWVTDLLCIEAITGRSDFPPEWYDIFSNKCRPAGQIKKWPSRALVREQLENQRPRLIDAIGTVSKKDLIGPPRTETLGTDRTLCYWVTHGLHDEANHQGEMYLLLKMQRKK